MTTTTAKNTLLAIMAALTIGTFGSGCGDSSEAEPDAGPTLATIDDNAESEDGTSSVSSTSPARRPDGGGQPCACVAPAGKFGTICVACP